MMDFLRKPTAAGACRAFLALGALIVLLPMAATALTGHTVAPLDSLRALAIPFWDGRFPQTHFWQDTVQAFWPRLVTLSRHEIPISYATGGGLPVYADTISEFFSPFAWLSFGWGVGGNGALHLFYLIKYVTAFIGTFLWLAACGLSPAQAFTGGILHSFATCYLPGTYHAGQTLGVMAVLPWALWAETRWRGRRSELVTLPLILALAVLSGNFQVSIYPLLAFGLWCLVQRRWFLALYAPLTAALLTLPFWWTGMEYHVLLNAVPLTERRSAMPVGMLGRLKALLALPAIFLSEIYGSTKHLDFLKAFETSGTYFIGSIGFVAGLVLASVPLPKWRRLWALPLGRFCILLLVFVLVAVATPLLVFLYYRVLCLALLALSVLFVLSLEHVELVRLRWLSAVAAVLLSALAATVAMVKANHGAVLREFFAKSLGAGRLGWWREWQEERIRRWFELYCADERFWGIVILCMALMVATRVFRNNRRAALLAVAFITLLDAVFSWKHQAAFQRYVAPDFSAYRTTLDIQRGSAAYPLSRAVEAECAETGPSLFGCGYNEFVGANEVCYYGSTMVKHLGLVVPATECDQVRRTVRFSDAEALRKLQADVVYTREGWTLEQPGYELVEKGRGYAVWGRSGAQRSAQGVLWGVDPQGATVTAVSHVVRWSHGGFEIKSLWSRDASGLFLSAPRYPGWRYFLDDQEISVSSTEGPYPRFDVDVSSGEHVFRAQFTPTAFLKGLAGTALALLLMAMVLARKKRAR